MKTLTSLYMMFTLDFSSDNNGDEIAFFSRGKEQRKYHGLTVIKSTDGAIQVMVYAPIECNIDLIKEIARVCVPLMMSAKKQGIISDTLEITSPALREMKSKVRS